MPLRFTKMHGLGNDYVYMSTHDQRIAEPAKLAIAVSDRHRGIGSDGLILIAPPPPGSDAHVRMEMYNADGSRGEMCGNGIRCVAKYTYERNVARVSPLRVATDRGVLSLELTIEAGKVERVRVDMGTPILEAAGVPVVSASERVIDEPLELDGATLHMTCVSMGNPHAVFYVEDLARVPLERWGPAIESHRRFPARVNAHFVQVRSRDYVHMVTWERGSGPTQACGTGASAVCVAGVLTERTAGAITARLPGGELQLEWRGGEAPVFMTGPATEVFDGVWPE